ncbi:MAG: homoaconitate hydratase, partial [Bacteroidetes bacterium]|nr:homoaconitate hydratase [Bacteroidota bacterium]
VQAILAESFGAIYERNAINAAFPIVTYSSLDQLDLHDGDEISLNFKTGELVNLKDKQTLLVEPFSEVQLEIYRNDGLF